MTPLVSGLVLFAAGAAAGMQNALAGGASFITIPILMLTGESALAANVTSTIALFPAQVATGFAARSMLPSREVISFPLLFIISLVGGAAGAVLLLVTPAPVFERLLPWLVLFATGVFAWSNFGRKPHALSKTANPLLVIFIQFFIAIYGGYFGGGIGFLMLAALSLVGIDTRSGLAVKNVLAGVMNASAVLIFVFSPVAQFESALILCAGAVIGGLLGVRMVRWMNERLLRIIVVVIGLMLAAGLFVRTA